MKYQKILTGKVNLPYFQFDEPPTQAEKCQNLSKYHLIYEIRTTSMLSILPCHLNF